MYTISKAPHLILRAPRGLLFCRTTTFSWCNNTIAREKCCLYPPADLPRGKTFFPSKRRESNSFHYHATHRIRDWIPRNEFWLFSRRIHFNNANIIQIPVCFALSFHFLHLFFSRSGQNSSTKRRGGHDMRFGRLPMFICDGETQYTIPLRTHCSINTPCNDH